MGKSVLSSFPSKKGLEGIPVNLPEGLGPGQRTLSDIETTPNGDLWASAARDEGDEGPFESMIYRVGSLTGDINNPVTLNLGEPHYVEGVKVEALTMNGERDHALFYGCDNETYGGSLSSTLFNV